jgi:hypothetical protein
MIVCLDPLVKAMAETHTILDLTVLPSVLRVYKAEVIRPVAQFLRSFQSVKERLKTQRQKVG